MRVTLSGLMLALLTSHAAASGCVEHGSEKESYLYRLCPNGIAYEKQYIYYGGWGEWTRMHPNVAPPCLWSAKDRVWQCFKRTIKCSETSCG